MHQLQPFSLFLMLLFSSNICIALDCTSSENGNQNKVAFTITVNQSGQGNFTTIQNAVDSIPAGNTQWIRIQISPGKYQYVNDIYDQFFLFI